MVGSSFLCLLRRVTAPSVERNTCHRLLSANLVWGSSFLIKQQPHIPSTGRRLFYNRRTYPLRGHCRVFRVLHQPFANIAQIALFGPVFGEFISRLRKKERAKCKKMIVLLVGLCNFGQKKRFRFFGNITIDNGINLD